MRAPPLHPEALSQPTRAALALLLAGPSLGGVRIGGTAAAALAWSQALLRLAAAMEAVEGVAGPVRRLPRSVGIERVCGGLDLPATLLAGRRVLQPGLLAEAHGGWLVVPDLQGVEPAVTTALAETIDRGVVRTERDGLAEERPARLRLLMLDPDDACPPALVDRLALQVEADAASADELDALRHHANSLARAQQRLATVRLEEAHRAEIAGAGLAGEGASIRRAATCVLVALVLAALQGRTRTQADDVHLAIGLVYEAASNASEAAEPAPADMAQAPTPHDSRTEASTDLQPGADTPAPPSLTATPLPADLLQIRSLEPARPSPSTARGRGGAKALPRASHGAPAGLRRRAGERRGLDLVQTLKAAAPLQAIRQGDGPRRDNSARLQVRPGDFRQRIRRPRPRTTAVFVVDGSGSAAAERLAEAKAAVEQFLARCYARRDRVAVVQFRGQGAEVVLAPTRAVARARRLLAEAPAGGATPLASGILAGTALALTARARGETALMVLLTDGRANVDRQGAPGREAALRDAHDAALDVAQSGLPSLLIDISPRGAREAERLAQSLGARRLHLPHLQATPLAAEVEALRRTALEARA